MKNIYPCFFVYDGVLQGLVAHEVAEDRLSLLPALQPTVIIDT